MGFRFPAPLLGAAAACVFLFLEANPIWGGTIASTMTGEFAYTYGIGLAVLFLGVSIAPMPAGSGPRHPRLLLALTAFAHGYAVLWAGLSATYFLYAARRPLRTLRWLATLAALAFALAGISLIPLLQAWGCTTPYDDPWIDGHHPNLFPPYLWPSSLALAGLGLLGTLLLARRTGGPDHRLLFLASRRSDGGSPGRRRSGPGRDRRALRSLRAAGAGLLASGATLGLALRPAVAGRLAALACVLLAVLWADAARRCAVRGSSTTTPASRPRSYGRRSDGSERRCAGRRGRSAGSRRVQREHEKAGSIRMYETLPFFTGRSTLEGVYNQASLQTHFVYFLASELGETSPNPFRAEYSSFDTDNAHSPPAAVRRHGRRGALAAAERGAAARAVTSSAWPRSHRTMCSG